MPFGHAFCGRKATGSLCWKTRDPSESSQRPALHRCASRRRVPGRFPLFRESGISRRFRCFRPHHGHDRGLVRYLATHFIHVEHAALVNAQPSDIVTLESCKMFAEIQHSGMLHSSRDNFFSLGHGGKRTEDSSVVGLGPSGVIDDLFRRGSKQTASFSLARRTSPATPPPKECMLEGFRTVPSGTDASRRRLSGRPLWWHYCPNRRSSCRHLLLDVEVGVHQLSEFGLNS